MNKILCLLALCALWNGYSSVAVEGQELAADIYIDEESKGYDEYEGSALYGDASGVDPYSDQDSEYEEKAESSGKPMLSDCELVRQSIQEQNLLGAYVPTCTLTGEYEAMQCRASTGECWCVNNAGETIPGTSAKSPWTPECKDVDRDRDYPKPSVKPKVDVGVEPTDSEEGSEEIVEAEEEGKMDSGSESDVDIGTVDTDDDDDDDTSAGGDSLSSSPEKLERNGLLGQPLILAGLIAIAVVCLLCAVLLVMFIVYRMRKKDEGSYALDEPKRSPSHPYQRAPTREYFA